MLRSEESHPQHNYRYLKILPSVFKILCVTTEIAENVNYLGEGNLQMSICASIIVKVVSPWIRLDIMNSRSPSVYSILKGLQ